MPAARLAAARLPAVSATRRASSKQRAGRGGIAHQTCAALDGETECQGPSVADLSGQVHRLIDGRIWLAHQHADLADQGEKSGGQAIVTQLSGQLDALLCPETDGKQRRS